MSEKHPVVFLLLSSHLWLKKSSETLGLVTLFLPFFKRHPLSGYHQRKDSDREGIFGLIWYGHSDLHMEMYLMSKLAKMNSLNQGRRVLLQTVLNSGFCSNLG